MLLQQLTPWVFTANISVNMNLSQIPRYTRGQDQNGLCCQQLLISASSVSQAILVAILHVDGWHMRTQPPSQAFLGEVVFRSSPQMPAQPRTTFLSHCYICMISDQSTVLKLSVDRLNMTHKLVIVQKHVPECDPRVNFSFFSFLR